VAETKPVLAVALDFHLPCVAMNDASARRAGAEAQAVDALQKLPGFQALTEAWRARERTLLSTRATAEPEALASYRRKARAYGMIRVALEQIATSAEAASAHRGGKAPTGGSPQAGSEELAWLLDLLAGATGQPSVSDIKDAQFSGGKAQEMVERATQASEAIAHPGWRVLMGFLSGIAWAHWLMLGAGVGDDAEHQDTIGVIAAMIQNAQSVLLQGRQAEQWFRTKAGET